MSAQTLVEGEGLHPSNGLRTEGLLGKDQFPGSTQGEAVDDENGSGIAQMEQGNVGEDISPSRDHQNAESDTTDTPVEPISRTALTILSLSFTAANFMVALDGSILATAIPRITSDFNGIDDVGWYGSAYLLAQMSTQPTFGRVFTFFDAKPTYLIMLLTFEIGSLICATAPNSIALIIGRAVAGIGAAGMLCGSLAIFGRVVPLRRRPLGMSIMTSVYGIAGVLGPTLGGLMTDTPRLTWRLCFWINLPFGAIAAVAMFFVLKPKPGIHKDLSWKQKISNLDLVSGFVLNCGLICLFIALQWGGNKYPWSNPKVWGCMIGFGVLGSIFVFLQARSKDQAVIPPRIVLQRTVSTSCVFVILYSMASITHSYYLPFYFQAVKGNSAAQSGLHGLPYGITATIGTIVGGAIMTFSGYYVPLMYIGSMILTTGCALLFTLSIGSNVSAWLGYQLVAGIGLGLSTQVPFIAVQVVVASDDMPTACALISFFRCFGGAVGISIAQNIFSSSLRNQLRQIPGVDANSLITAGAGNLSGSVTPTLLEAVREAYCYAVTRAYILPIAVAAVSVLCSFRMEWKIIKDDRNPKGGTQGSASGTPSGNLSGAKTGIPVQLPVEAAEVAHIRETSDKSQ